MQAFHQISFISHAKTRN